MQVVLGDLAGVSKSTVCRIVAKVSQSIASLMKQYVIFPNSQHERARTMTDFHRLAGFPGVLGAVDGTHIAIQSPG